MATKQKQSQRQKQKKRSTQRIFEYKNVRYVCVFHNGKVVVKTTRTAHGQQQIAGVLDVAEKTWQKGNKNTPLPKYIKIKVEESFL